MVLAPLRMCPRCQTAKLFVAFQNYRDKRSGGKLRVHSYCKECRRKETDCWRTSEAGKQNFTAYRDKRRTDIRYHCQRRLINWRRRDPRSDLTVDYLVDLYLRQGKRCYYSGQEMVVGGRWRGYHYGAASLDRLDPAKGYVRGNVVWCLNLVNTMKQQLTEQQFYEFIANILRHRERQAHHVRIA